MVYRGSPDLYSVHLAKLIFHGERPLRLYRLPTTGPPSKMGYGERLTVMTSTSPRPQTLDKNNTSPGPISVLIAAVLPSHDVVATIRLLLGVIICTSNLPRFLLSPPSVIAGTS